MSVNEGELGVIFDGVWSGCVGSATIFNCLLNALKLQPGIDAETLVADLQDQLRRYVEILPQPSLGQQTVALAASLLEPEEGA